MKLKISDTEMVQELKDLKSAADEFIQSASEVSLSKPVYDNGWNAKQIIGHIVYYHEYYARVLSAIVKKSEPPLIDRSLAAVNIDSANVYSKLSRKELLDKFKRANSIFVKSTQQIPDSTIIPYKKGGSVYTPSSYVEVIARHIMKHSKDLGRVIKKKY